MQIKKGTKKMKNIDYTQIKENDEFHRLKPIDLQELLVQVQNYLLEYRNPLSLPYDIKFQIAIQHDHRDEQEVEVNHNWNSKRIWDEPTHYALISPISENTPGFWNELQQSCKNLKKKYTRAKPYSDGRIKIGTSVLDNNMEVWRIFLKLYSLYEHVLYRFGYGESINARKDILKRATPIAEWIYINLQYINQAQNLGELESILHKLKNTSVDFNKVSLDFPRISFLHNHLEFNSPNGTFEEVIWQNNINAYAKMLDSARNNVINEKFLDYKFKRKPIPYFLYDSIHLQDALEFVDLVFDNNLDKIYFLKQYLKNYKEAFGMEKTIQAPSFIKKRGLTYGKR